MTHVKSITVALALAGGLVGCTPRVLITNNFLPGGKISKSYIIPRADDNKQFNYFVRVCDQKASTKAIEASNCKDTLVVDHILR